MLIFISLCVIVCSLYAIDVAEGMGMGGVGLGYLAWLLVAVVGMNIGWIGLVMGIWRFYG